ncbi:hypothetical protein [Luteimonas sp. A482]
MRNRSRLGLAIVATLLVAVACGQTDDDRAAPADGSADTATTAAPAATSTATATATTPAGGPVTTDGVPGTAPTAAAADPAAAAAALFGTIPERVEELRGKPLSAEQVELGHMLFFDPRLSRPVS